MIGRARSIAVRAALALGVAGVLALAVADLMPTHRGPATGPRTPGTATALTHASSGPTRPSGSAPGSVAARADRTHEVPTPATPQRVAGGSTSPQAALRAFAAEYVNWTAATAARHMSALARGCVGQARAMVTLAAGELGRDSELRAGGIANAGTVEAVAPVTGRVGSYAVITRERTIAARSSAYQGLAPAWHVAVATVARVRGGWVVSGWQPES